MVLLNLLVSCSGDIFYWWILSPLETDEPEILLLRCNPRGTEHGVGYGVMCDERPDGGGQ
ncbi:hypothetical protein GCM10007173_07430 [Glutamicibacter ardleyensis]|uniref:Uncharacterized protein n=1 Tax=Glutamicibacter ardleyensis TaxID=225894 RepID=A0ABQ2DB16_9MICC|nr:hypothetical protein GCM10007173_07430 [Glutamicibacter ardleyensis]